MNKTFVNVLKYVLALGAGVALFWYSIKDVDFNKAYTDVLSADKSWLVITIVIALLAHLSRAARWNILMKPMGEHPHVFKTFLAVMTGYLANAAVPRLGEVSRSAVLQNMTGVPFNKSFGAVVTERVFDVICLFILIGITLLVEFEKISGYLMGILSDKWNGIVAFFSNNILLLVAMIAIFLLIVLGIYTQRQRIRKHSLSVKIIEFLKGLWTSMLSVKDLKRTDIAWFFFHTVFIWGCYFLMTYLVFFCFPFTEHLGLGAGLSILVVGGLGMSAPVPGGFGTFHTFVAGALVVYGVSYQDGLTYAFLVHTSQFLAYAFFGGLCFITAMLISKKRVN